MPNQESGIPIGQLMAFDYGLKRIGVAVGNTVTKTAQPLVVIRANNETKRFSEIEQLVKQWQPVGFVVGVPYHEDGSENSLTASCQRFSRQLAGRYKLPCATVNERYSSVVVDQPKEAIDMHSAQIILEQYFQEAR